MFALRFYFETHPLTKFGLLETLAVAKVLCVNAIPSLADSKQPELVATIAVMVALASVAVILRFYCRRIIRATLGADDYMILIALASLKGCHRCIPTLLTMFQLLTYSLNINSFLCKLLLPQCVSNSR